MSDEHRSTSIKQRNGASRVGALLAALAAWASLFPLLAGAHSSTAPLVGVEVFDRTIGTNLDVYAQDGQRFVIGTPGHEYAIRIRNRSAGRILAVTSVDGVNVVTGETASSDQSGYVIPGGESFEIVGWRRSLERTAAFYFTDLGKSYAARTGRPADVGVVGVAVFRERVPSVVWPQGAAVTKTPRSAAAEPAAAPSTAQSDRSGARDERTAEMAANAAPAPRLGTGFGRTETSFVYRVRFDRDSDTPAETIAIRYDRRENLAAMGVLPQPRYADRAPDPFPAMRFVPEPPR